MTEQYLNPDPDDAQGHMYRAADDDSTDNSTDDDTQGHVRRETDDDTDDDTQGHVRR